MKKPTLTNNAMDQVFKALTAHMGSSQIQDMLNIDPKLTKKSCAEWLVENAYNQCGHLCDDFTMKELDKLDKMLLKEARVIANSSL